MIIVRRHGEKEGNSPKALPYEKAANALMNASGYVGYVARHGYHFTPELADMAGEMMQNADGSSHRWRNREILSVIQSVPDGVTLGDMTYLANMAYADFYPKVLRDANDCIKYATAVAQDPDGYEGMAFCRWTADMIGKGATVDWEKLE